MAPADHTQLASAMASGFDRLEKLFLKKKMSPSSTKLRSSPEESRCTTPSLTSPSHSDLEQSVFPAASFVRPSKATRMMARNEVSDKTSPPRSKTPAFPMPPDSAKPQKRLSYGATQSSGSGAPLQGPEPTMRLRLFPSGDAHDISRMSIPSSPGAASNLEPSGSAASFKRFSSGDAPETSAGVPTSLSSSSSVRIPRRSSSLMAKRKDGSLAGMVPLHMAKRTRKDRESAPLVTAEERAEPADGSKALLAAAPIYPTSRVDTPPPSDADDNGSPTEQSFKPKHPLIDVSAWPSFQPTPGPSPEMSPVCGSSLGNARPSEENPAKTRVCSVPPPPAPPREAVLRKVLSDPCLGPPSKRRPDQTLEEVRWGDFLSLSDEDIAERHLTPLSPPPAMLPPPPPVPPPSARASLLSPTGDQMMPASPLGKRPAAIAAFEAARIGKKYDLDLLYVASLWPARAAGNLDGSQSGPVRSGSVTSRYPISPASATSATPLGRSGAATRDSMGSLSDIGSGVDGEATPCFNRRTGLTGRILAAYGLAEVKSPFRLSGAVHKKILRTDGWVEYRHAEPKPDEFARGYACAFHAGHSPDGRRNSAPDNQRPSTPRPQTPTSPQKLPRDTTPKNRGIVFAAYRKPRADGGSITSSPAELAALYDDAEGLVELLIDLHVAQRHRERVKEGRRAKRSSKQSRRSSGATISETTST